MLVGLVAAVFIGSVVVVVVVTVWFCYGCIGRVFAC